MVFINTVIFLRGSNYAEKAELSKYSRYPKRKLGVINFQFGIEQLMATSAVFLFEMLTFSYLM